MSSSSEVSTIVERPPGQKIERGEVFLLCCSVISLLTSCILWSPHKQVWMDEIFTWKEVSDRSLWHLYYAIQHGADGGQPLFYTTAWLLGESLWHRCILRFACIPALPCAGHCSSPGEPYGASMDCGPQPLECSFSGAPRVCCSIRTWKRDSTDSTCLCVAITVDLYTRLVARPAPTRLLLVLVFFSQAALVLTHVLGLIYSGLILLALILFDAAKGRLRWKLYLAYAAGWLALLVWIPAIRSSMAAGKPHGWIAMPTVTDLRTAYLFADSLSWLRLFKRHSLEVGFQIVSRAAEFRNLCSAGCSFSALPTTNLAGQDGEPSLIQGVLCCWSLTFCYLRR